MKTRSQTKAESRSAPTPKAKGGTKKKTPARKPAPCKTKPAARKATKRPAKQIFRNIPQGAGGTFTLELLTVIGTTNCHTCLGLYVPLAPNKCFVAHFNFEPHPNDGTERMQDLPNYVIGPACYRAVVMMTKEFLGHAQWEGCWGTLTAEMRTGLQMTCPMSGWPGLIYVGDAVAEGVKEFFGVGGDRKVRSSNLLVRYAAGAAPETIHPSHDELRNNWRAIDETDNGHFATAGFFDDGRVRKGDEDGDETEGPFEA